jgi:hypothetical protein
VKIALRCLENNFEGEDGITGRRRFKFDLQKMTGRLPEFLFVSCTFFVIAPDSVKVRISANPVFVKRHAQPPQSKRDVRLLTADRQYYRRLSKSHRTSRR